MRFLDLYYALKPFVPHRLRLRLRQLAAQRMRRRCRDSWPIAHAAGNPPLCWPGWPNHRSFAFVITHDVEGQRGMERCRRLAEVDRGLGYRSSFNLVPEGSYRTPLALLEYLTLHGFEVGVHDLHHDGTLYRSFDGFRRAAVRINHHLRRWGAVGFRSAFMLHNLEWLKALDVLYDASTFDTDPFEPQPDGVNTIFPFWVGGLGDGGFVELPYTLAQDSTLFLVLRERTNDIWKRKLDWVAERGGLALVNVHPDYLDWRNRFRGTEYPLALYEDFLRYTRTRYDAQAWYALPRDVAAYLRPHLSDPKNTGRVASLAGRAE